MNDMSSVIVPKSDQINAETLLSGPVTVTVKDVSIRGGQDQPVSIALQETPLYFRPCKSMSRVLVAAWGPDASKYVGRSMTLYRDPAVKWAGMQVGGIRISHMSHIERDMVMALTETKGKRAPHTVKVLQVGGGQSQIEISIDQARHIINSAPTMDALAEAWRKKSMAPHRDALQSDLDKRKAELSAEGPTEGRTDEQHGESDQPPEVSHYGYRLEQANDAAAVEAIAEEFDTWKHVYEPDDYRNVKTQIETVRAKFAEKV